MPQSPIMRISPGRELKSESHKRGYSLESGILYHEKDDDLALFNEVQNKESDNFLLQSNDDFDDIFATKLRGFSNHKLGISNTARGESSDLLKAEGNKNDYDWLITPPDTPLFSSLDDETPPINLATRGRPRSQPISISRSPTMEKGNRSARGSASPHRLSPSPRSSNSTLQSRSKPFSATHSSPPPILRNSPSRGLSPPPSKPKTGPRSSTPTPGRMSTGSTGSRVRVTSPIKTSRGNSASPKLRAWQTNIPGFSSEAPPNLRTSLADRPASYVRGSSPASRTSSRTGRQSLSPTPCRSVSSSHSHERDPFSSISKGSVASSGDDVDSLQSVPISTCDSSAPSSAGAFSSSRVVGFSKKPIKALSSSAPKRSYDLALKQMERERKSPQNMFRPLLSSVPSSTFYAGNAASHHRSLTSINSSITTSSNASSDRGTSGAHDTEEEQNHEDVTSDSVKGQYFNVPDEIFVMDQSEALNDVENRVIESTFNEAVALSEADAAAVISDRNFDCTDACGIFDALLCSKCSGTFPPGELVMEGDLQVCMECKGVEINSAASIPVKRVMEEGMNIEAESVHVLEHEPLKILVGSTPIQESLNLTGISETKTDHLEDITDAGRNSYTEPSHNVEISLLVNNQNVDVESGEQQLENARFSSNSKADIGESTNSKIDVSEGAGISLLLKRSSSGKRNIVQSRSFTASNISYDGFSYGIDSVNSMRTSFGQSSASSSVDLGPSRQTNTYIQRQLSGLKSDMDNNYRFEMPTKHKRSSSSLSGSSSHVFQVTNVAPNYHEDNLDPHERSVPSSEFTEAESMCTIVENNIVLKTVGEVQGDLAYANFGGTEMISVLATEELVLHENDGDLKDDCNNLMAVETSSVHVQNSGQWEDATLAEVPNPSSLDAISEMDIENPDIVNADSLSDVGSSSSISSMDEIEENAALEGHNDAVSETVGEIVLDPVHVCEESTVVLEDLGGTKARSLTLDEATDAILFCSSIVHNLAYEAANIAINKENSPVEVLRPTIPVIGKSVPERRDMRSKRRNSKSMKARQRKLETDTKPPSIIDETNEIPSQRFVGTPDKADSLKPPKLESKCNCTIM